MASSPSETENTIHSAKPAGATTYQASIAESEQTHSRAPDNYRSSQSPEDVPATRADISSRASGDASGRGSNLRLPRPSFDGPDRVFPIRSVISVEPSSTVTTSSPPSTAGFGTLSPCRDEQTWRRLHPPTEDRSEQVATSPEVPRQIEDVTNEPQSAMSLASGPSGAPPQHPDIEQIPSNVSGGEHSMTSSTEQAVTIRQAGTLQPSKTGDDNELVTARFQHIATEGGHAVITGRDGANFQYCEDEPIHIPGAIQSFGALIALHEETEGKLVVRVVSENVKTTLGYSPNELFALESFTDILTEEQEDNLLDHVDFIRDEACDPRIHDPEVFILSIASPSGEMQKFWCAIHINQVNKDLIICEFEIEDDVVHPLNVSGEKTPEEPSDTLGLEPTPEQLAASTVNISRPLRVLRSARRRRGEAAAMRVFNILTQIQEQLSAAPNLDALLNTTVGLVKELTGFHRVMIYQFDNSWNGVVVAELVDRRKTKDLYKGLHFPASDIPKQARELYKINKVRILYDRDLITSRLVCRTLKDLETPLDMTHAYLRAMSPIHLKYLAHMEVRASMSISMNVFNELWGLISCHAYGSNGMRVSFPIRKMCRLIGDAVSRNIERLSYASRLQARKLINTVPTEANPSGYIIASSDDLLKLFEADYGALSIRDETKILGRLSHSQEVLALVEYLKMRQINAVLASHDINRDFPDLTYPPGFKHISGLLYVPLSAGGRDFIVFFRKGHLTEIKWAGNPYEKEMRQGTSGYLEPRKSFQTWRETVLGRSREWSESDVETAAVLCLVYGKFIEVWRQKEAAMQSTQLTKLLLANSAHEVRTPLNAIINYLEIALEGVLDAETRENLAKSHSASKSLIYVINDLLDLTNTEQGQKLIKDEVFDFPATLTEATNMFDGEAKRKGVGYYVNVYPGVPKSVLGDQRRVRQVIINMIANAIQHTSTGAVTVEVWRSPNQPEGGDVDVEIAVLDTGRGMSQATVDALFRDLEQVSFEDDNYYYEQEQEGATDVSSAREGGQKRVLGLGLALVARIVRNMHGQLSVKSEEGKGSRFKVTLRFPLPETDSSTTEPSEAVQQNGAPTIPAATEGDVLLVDRNIPPRSSQRQHSVDSSRSGGSFGSFRSNRSEADRLISAIQEPPLVNRVGSTDGSSESKKSRDSGESPIRAGPPPPPTSPNQRAGKSPPVSRERGLSHTSLPGTNVKSLVPLGSAHLPGQQPVTDSGVPLSAVRVGDTDIERPYSPKSHDNYARPGSVAYPSTGSEGTSTTVTSPAPRPDPFASDSMNVLVAEDDPINSKIVQKRLDKLGHSVKLTVNGEECASAFRSHPGSYDAILMDIQMPIVDGMSAAKMIREIEALSPERLSDKAKHYGRIPIFAVSASLVERDLQKYIDAGFDGWIMKPIDFKRLSLLLIGLQQEEIRRTVTYKPGMWEDGGWFDLSTS